MEDGARARRSRRRWLRRALALVAVVVLAVEGAWLLEARALRAEADRVDERAASARGAVEARRAELVAADADLEDARRALDTRDREATIAADARGHAIADREAAMSELARLQAEVRRLEEAIGAARLWRDINLLTIAGLDRCLEGVGQFLNQVSVGDVDGAVRTAQAAAGVCESIGAPLEAGAAG